MSLTSHATSSLRSTQGPDVSRSTLKHLAQWIRDDLDILVAREGPDVLRPDDVVTLHELFVALRQSTTITVLDLRATGIHKAVKDIAGIATRWPGKLCDDCEKIIALWTSRFGPLDELHPFLYGRRGRLEGIASLAEYSREALLKKWSQHCPDKIEPRVSHRQGSLGFRAGDWWISSLFAHHAGIIGLESVEGGTTYDKNGAYALVLKDVSDVDARDQDSFTYRFPNDDNGRFRLTAATAKSREAIRVLRSHSVNSIWGPKAGIRYEGLYQVKGWCIRQAKLNDTFAGNWKEGDVLYDVTLQRQDPVPMDEVTKRPTNMEVDDYAEYKRLRKLHRGDKGKEHGVVATVPGTTSILPPLQPPVSPSAAPQSLLRMSPSISRTAPINELAFEAPKASRASDRPPPVDAVSPMTVLDQQISFFAPRQATGYAMLANGGVANTVNPSNGVSIGSGIPDKQGRESLASVSRSITDDLKEILPWIELEDELVIDASLKDPSTLSPQGSAEDEGRLQSRATGESPIRRSARDTGWSMHLSSRIEEAKGEDAATKEANFQCSPPRPMPWLTRERDIERFASKAFGKTTKFFDGAGYGAGEEHCIPQFPSEARHVRSSPVEEALQLRSPTVTRSARPNDLCYDHGIEDIEFAPSLDNLISRPRLASPVNSNMSFMLTDSSRVRVAGEGIALTKLRRWLSK